MIAFILKLFLAHIIGDFILQPAKWVEEKTKLKIRSRFLYYHLAVHTIALTLLLAFQFKYWLGITIIMISHLIIDLIKIYFQSSKNRRWFFFADQFLHLLILVFVTSIYYRLLPEGFAIHHTKLLLIISALACVSTVAAILMQVIISRWDHLSIGPEVKEEGLEKAGYYIGILERLFVFGFIVLGHWEGVGFLLAAKSIFRFGDLSKAKDRKLTEYILIGTLLSFGIAVCVALSYLWILKFIHLP